MTFLRGSHKGSAAILWGENLRVRMSTVTDLGFALLLMSNVKAVRRHKFYPTLSYSVKFNGTHSGRYHNVHFFMRTVLMALLLSASFQMLISLLSFKRATTPQVHSYLQGNKGDTEGSKQPRGTQVYVHKDDKYIAWIWGIWERAKHYVCNISPQIKYGAIHVAYSEGHNGGRVLFLRSRKASERTFTSSSMHILACTMSAWHLLAQARPHDVVHLTGGSHAKGKASTAKQTGLGSFSGCKWNSYCVII